MQELSLRATLSEGVGVWLVEEPVDSRIGEAIAMAEARLVPAGSRLAQQAVHLCVEVLSAKSLPVNVEDVYVAMLGSLPADLLAQSVRGALTGCTYHKLPPPGAFLSAVQPQLDERRALLGRLRRHASRVALARLRRHANVVFR